MPPDIVLAGEVAKIVLKDMGFDPTRTQLVGNYYKTDDQQRPTYFLSVVEREEVPQPFIVEAK